MTCTFKAPEKYSKTAGRLEMDYQVFTALQEELVSFGGDQFEVASIVRETLAAYLDFGEVWVPSGPDAWMLDSQGPLQTAVAGRLTRGMNQLLRAIDAADTAEILAFRRRLRI